MKEVKISIGFSIAGFVLGLLSLILSFLYYLALPLAVLAIILSIIQLIKKPTGLAIVGLVLGILGILVAFAILIFSLIMQPDLGVELAEGVENTVVLLKNDYKYIDSVGRVYKGETGGSGVMFAKDDANTLKILTNRHVVDCNYIYECGQRTQEQIRVMTYDGKMHNVSRVFISPHEMDIAIIEIKNVLEDYPLATIAGPVEKSERVFAIGYPAFSLNAREFSKRSGMVIGFRDLLTDEGYSFKAIDTTAYANFGSSGGGLFDSEGNLVGLTTWGSDYRSFAISSDDLKDRENYYVCEEGAYYTEEGCLEYCSFVLKDSECIKPCNGFYCESEIFYAGDDRCEDNSLILGDNGLCNKPCGSKDTYCPDELTAFCYQNKCRYCPYGKVPYEDGYCR